MMMELPLEARSIKLIKEWVRWDRKGTSKLVMILAWMTMIGTCTEISRKTDFLRMKKTISRR